MSSTEVSIVEQHLQMMQKRKQDRFDAMPQGMKDCIVSMHEKNEESFAAAVAGFKDRINDFCPYNEDALVHIVAREENLFYLRALVAAGADINLLSRPGIYNEGPCWTPIGFAADMGNLENVRYLLSCQADLTVASKGKDPFIFALFKSAEVYFGMADEIVQSLALLAPNIDPVLRNAKGESFLSATLRKKPFIVVKTLVDSGYPVSAADVAGAIDTGRVCSLQILVDKFPVTTLASEVDVIRKAVEIRRNTKSDDEESYWQMMGEVYDPHTCASIGEIIIEGAERMRLEAAVKKIYTGGDKPLPLPKMRR